MRISEGRNVYQLASNMGTSVDMIEMYYGKKRNTDPRNVSEVTKITTPRGTHQVKGDDENPSLVILISFLIRNGLSVEKMHNFRPLPPHSKSTRLISMRKLTATHCLIK